MELCKQRLPYLLGTESEGILSDCPSRAVHGEMKKMKTGFLFSQLQLGNEREREEINEIARWI